MVLREVIFHDADPKFFLHCLHWYFEQVEHDNFHLATCDDRLNSFFDSLELAAPVTVLPVLLDHLTHARVVVELIQTI